MPNKKIQVGDLVVRVSHGKDILFKVEDVYRHDGEEHALLKGVDLRLSADAPAKDLELKTTHEVNGYRQPFIKKGAERLRSITMRREKDRNDFFTRAKVNYLKPKENTQSVYEIPGTVLHFDGDKEYLDLCLNTYEQLKIKAVGYHIPEQDQPRVVKEYLRRHNPDILVATGHDGIIKGKKDLRSIDSYRNSKYYIETVRNAREIQSSRDDLVIFAGACQSHYEAILMAGANYASAPRRVLIHAYDPVFIVEKIAFTPINEVVEIKEIITSTITGDEGVGGIETKGRLRRAYPPTVY